MLDGVNEWLKAAVLEVQEYVRLCAAAGRGMVSRPFYYRDLVEQFEQIGIGSLTVVLLTGLFTGAVLALQSGLTLDQFGARPFVGRLVSASMIKELGPVLTALMLTGTRRVGHRGRAGIDDGGRTDQRAARAGHRSDPQAGRAANPGRDADVPGAHGRGRLRRHPRRLGDCGLPAARGVERVLDVGARRAVSGRTRGWGSSSPSSSASSS